MLAEGRNEAIHIMSFRQLCTIVIDGFFRKHKKSFKQTLFALNPDGSEDSTKGSRRLQTSLSQMLLPLRTSLRNMK